MTSSQSVHIWSQNRASQSGKRNGVYPTVAAPPLDSKRKRIRMEHDYKSVTKVASKGYSKRKGPDWPGMRTYSEYRRSYRG